MPIDHSELRKRECHCAFFPFRAKAICKIAGETASIDEAMQKIANGWLMHGESEMKGNRYAD